MMVFVDHQLEQGKCRFEHQVSATFIVCGKLKLESLFGTYKETVRATSFFKNRLNIVFLRRFTDFVRIILKIAS